MWQQYSRNVVRPYLFINKLPVQLPEHETRVKIVLNVILYVHVHCTIRTMNSCYLAI